MITDNSTVYAKPATLQTIWLIARRQMLDAMRDRSTLIMTGFFLILQAGLIWFSLNGSLRGHIAPREAATIGGVMAFFLLYAGLIPSAPAIGIASGVFAGDKERGCLTPILVTPASNVEIFAGKILGAVLPALLYAMLSIVLYFVEIALFFGADKLLLLPVPLTIMII
ncbi:MAG TPA: ABC transporter permease, partial [Ktedonobacteraceae bacterium]|nr:ABC transporter permease [Ktedonobacteraceae bacterium]